MECLVYLFCNDESATVMNVPVLRGICPSVNELSLDHMRQIYINLNKMNDVDVDLKDIEEFTIQQLSEELNDQLTYRFTHAALVAPKQEGQVERRGDKFLNEMGGNDSDCYRAAEGFADYLSDIAIKVIEFPDAITD